MVAERTRAIETFIFHAQEDEALLDALEKQLATMKKQGLITTWSTRNTSLGDEPEREIAAHLESARIILLLVSPDLMAAKYDEIRRAAERHKTACVIPIILRPTDYRGAPFDKLLILPKENGSITGWSDQDKAFTHVVGEIRKVVEEMHNHSPVDAATPSTSDPIPYARNRFFTGREEILEDLHTSLHSGRTAALTQAISGLGGIGKTQTAIEYAYRYQHEYEHIFWVKADTREGAIADMLAIALRLNLREYQEQDQALVLAAVKRWFTQHERWLLIFDNADNLDLIRDMLPSTTQGHTLLTTRSQIVGNTARRIDLPIMNPALGATLLLRRATILNDDAPLDKAPAADQTHAKEISRLMGGLPLALDQAGAYIEETGCGVETYLQRYQTRQADLLKRRGHNGKDHPDPVATTWSLSFEKVQQENPSAADILRVCAFLDPDAIPEDIIIKGASVLGPTLQHVGEDETQLDEAIGALRKYSLIRRDPNGTLTIHRLVQAALKQAMKKSEQRRWAERAVRAVNLVFPDVDYDTWLLCQQYLPHAQSCANLIEQWDMAFAEAARLLNKAGYFLYDQAQYSLAEPLFQRALAIREKVLGAEHRETATSLNNLGALYDDLGIYEQAEPLYKRALVIRERVLGTEHSGTATSLNNLALLYKRQGKYEEAEPLYKRALAIDEKVLGAEHPETATDLNNLAELYKAQGKYEEAEPLYKRALAIREKMQGAEHPETATYLNNLAELYKTQGKYKQAESLYKRAIEIREKMQGMEHPYIAVNLNNLALLYHNQGKYEEAELLLKRALAIFEKVLGAEHPNTVLVRENYALLLQEMNESEHE